MRLTLLVPEVIWPEPADQMTLGKLSAPGFEWLAAHARFERRGKTPFETSLARQFNCPEHSLAALRLLGENSSQLATEGNWLCADPVHLRFHHERVILADAGAFELDDAEALGITEALNAEFADIGRFHVATTRRWYLRLNAAVDHLAEPISAVAGRRVDSDLPKGDATLNRWLNEVQMFLHGHPINERRQAEGKPIVNSLWLWGAGRPATSTHTAFDKIWSNNPLAQGLALASSVPFQPCPNNLADLLKQRTPDSKHLLVLDELLPRVLYEDSEGWRDTWLNLDQHWFSPLRAALGRQISSLNIVAPCIYGELEWQLQGADRWKFWRKPRSLAALAADLAEGNP